MQIFPGSKKRIATKWLIPLVLIFCLIIYAWVRIDAAKTQTRISADCENSLRYDIEKKLWSYFDQSGVGGYFQTKEDAFDQCINQSYSF